MTNRGDELIARVAATGSDTMAAELLDEFFSGYPVEKLRALLGNDNEAAVKAGAWIASELGDRVAPVMDDLARLLTHPSRYVRFFALDAVLGGATAEHGSALAAAVRSIEDQDKAVRWKALNFLARAGYDQLVASVADLRASKLGELVQWLLESDRTLNGALILERIEDADRLSRVFAAAAAARLARHDPLLLSRVATVPDPEVSSFAREQLDAMRDSA